MKYSTIKETRCMVIRETPAIESMIVMDNPKCVYEAMVKALENSPVYRPDVENFICIFLDTRRRLIGFEVIGTGTLDTLLVHPREVFKAACLNNAAAIVLAHNHPSGDPTPSEADVRVTRDLMRAGQMMKIEVLDHIILGNRSNERPYTSLRELGYFYT